MWCAPLFALVCQCRTGQPKRSGRFIRSVSATNFKSFRDFHVPFDPGFNVICGSNGAGKSNLIDAIGFAFGEVRLAAHQISKPA